MRVECSLMREDVKMIREMSLLMSVGGSDIDVVILIMLRLLRNE